MDKETITYLILLVITTAVISFIREVVTIEHQTSNTIYWAANLVFIFFWCIFHSKKSLIDPSYIKALLCGAIPPIGIPIYFYSSFGFKSGSVRTLKTIAFLFLLILTGVIFESIGEHYAL